MNLKMNDEERDAFLAETRIAIICIERKERPPLAVPIWYSYDPAVGISVSTQNDSLKAKLLKAAGRFTIIVQEEERPHRYVSAEGPIIDFRAVDPEKDIRPMAEVYAPEEVEMYIQASSQFPSSLIVMKPDTWRTMDQSKVTKA